MEEGAKGRSEHRAMSAGRMVGLGAVNATNDFAKKIWRFNVEGRSEMRGGDESRKGVGIRDVGRRVLGTWLANSTTSTLGGAVSLYDS